MINKSNTIGLPFLYLIMIVIIFALNLPMPQDDLLRDVVAGEYGYDYTQLYVHAPLLAKYNQYIAFDQMLHWSVILIGKLATVHLVQSLCHILFVAPCILIYLHFMRKDKNCYVYLTIILMLLLNNYTMVRLTLARPEMIFTCWIFWGLWLKFTARTMWKLTWLLIGLLMIPGYWLAFFYIPAILVVFDKARIRLLAACIFLLVTIVFWQNYSNGQWFSSILELGILNNNRLAIIGENKSIALLLLTPITSTALIVYLYTYKNFVINQVAELRPNLKCLHLNLYHKIKAAFKLVDLNSPTSSAVILILCYSSLNMIRYSAIITGLFCILVAIRLVQLKLTIPPVTRYILLCLAIFLPMTVNCYQLIPKFTIPAESIVLGTNQSNYYVPFYSSGIKIAPAMEIGANDQGIQLLMKEIDINGTVSCTQLNKYHFNYLVERNLTIVPSCLKIYQIQKGWRAWKVVNE